MIPPAATTEYRRDIDGLRAFAVAIVVLFHLGVPWTRGGFAGVDVFFVISGYLITGIIIRGLERSEFTLSGFYARRINRIVPALLVVLATTWLLGWLFMFALEFKKLGVDVMGGSSFLSNFIFWDDLGYWDSPAKPLLHLWSLAVEEQFYLFWPLTLLAVSRAKRNVRWTIIAIIEISFVVNLYQVRHGSPAAAFYLPLSRFWEILSGALLFQIESSDDSANRLLRAVTKRFRHAMSIAGGLLLIATLVLAQPYDPWPGLRALLPVGGTLLLIAAGPDALLNRTLLSMRAVVGVGLISYPLYLWHLPLILFGQIVFEKDVPILYTIAIIPSAMVLAWWTYAFVEKPIRFGNRKKRSATILVPGLVATWILGVIAYRGFAGPRLQESLAALDRRWGEARVFPAPETGTSIKGSGPPIFAVPGGQNRTVVLYGDSHMNQYWPRVQWLESQWKGTGPTVVLIGYAGCAMLPDAEGPGQAWRGDEWNCARFNRDVIEYASRPEVSTLVLSGFWELYLIDAPRGNSKMSHLLRNGDERTEVVLEKFETQIRALTAAGKKVYIVLSNPVAEVRVNGKTLRRFAGFGTPIEHAMATTEFHNRVTRWTSNRLRRIAANAGAIVIDPAMWLCGPRECPSKLPTGEPIYADDNHLRAGFVGRYASWFDPVFSQ